MSDKTPITQKKVIIRHAFNEGLVTGGIVAAISGAGVLAGHKWSSTFRNRLGISGKTAIVVMSSLAAFSVKSEGKINQGARNPDNYIASIDTDQLQRHLTGVVDQQQLQWQFRVANWIYDHPFRTIALAGVPIVGAIFYEQSKNTSIKLSQQIMHTRVYGQGSIILLLLSSMAFHDWMERHGKFE